MNKTASPKAPDAPDAGPDSQAVENLLREVIDPELGSDIVELGMYKGVEFSGSTANVKVALTTKGCPLRSQIQKDVKGRLMTLPGIEDVKLVFTELTQEEKAKTMDIARARISEQNTETTIPQNTRVLLVASGKGGVGKSTIAVNLAVSLAEAGYKVGLMDADIWGFSVPRLLGMEGRLEGSLESGKIVPHILKAGALKADGGKTEEKGKAKKEEGKKEGEVKVVSMGFLVDSEETALMWRGLILNRAVQHFLQDVDWGELDYLLVDMPPGTGDVQMGIARMLPRSEMLVVTMPPKNAAKVAGRVISMGRKNYLRIAGIIENQSGFVDSAGKRHELFGAGGGEALSKETGVPLLGKIPIEPEIAELGDEGKPAALNSKSEAARIYKEIAKEIYTTVAPPLDMESCSARIEGIGPMGGVGGEGDSKVRVSLGATRTSG